MLKVIKVSDNIPFYISHFSTLLASLNLIEGNQYLIYYKTIHDKCAWVAKKVEYTKNILHIGVIPIYEWFKVQSLHLTDALVLISS